MGHQAIADTFGGELSDTYWISRTRNNMPDHTPGAEGEDNFTLMAERGLAVIDRVVVEQMGGTIDTNTGEWVIPGAGPHF